MSMGIYGCHGCLWVFISVYIMGVYKCLRVSGCLWVSVDVYTSL